MNWLIGLGLAGLIALVAGRMRWLTTGGALMATLVGASVFGAGGVSASIPMLAFFLSGSMLPHALGRPHKTDRRTAFQVAANGLAPMLCCWGVLLYPEMEPAFWLGYAASLATATADTWATEFGVRFSETAWMVTTGRRVPAGESGAISVVGTLSGMLGAHILAVFCTPLMGYGVQAWAVWGLGVGGMVLDSLLGATLQGRFQCAACGATGEQRLCCGASARLVRGVRWVDNNAVNLLSTLATAGAAILVWE
ncbi:MAG: DUF92 domain-containing protein [Fimbriimonadales bacterium]|nr:DUF92 domain-containing protein [Fimbriimonadales bacterium]